ncbi:MAG: hypothetical protein WBD55_03615 [Dehalococcoidia bacterium]
MWPNERVALLAIHGIGQQDPFEILDGFVQSLRKTLEAQNPGSTIAASHILRDENGWTESCLSLTKDGDEETAIDCYEYYWAHETQRRIDMGEVFDWVFKTGLAAEKYYAENQELVRAYEQRGDDAFSGGRFKKYWYLKHLGKAGWFAHKLLTAAPLLFSTFPRAAKPIQFLMRVIGSFTKPFIADSLGDVTIYTTTDVKSVHFPIRRNILNGAVQKVEWLLQSERPSYDRIVLVGHSLGSVIAYDTLNRVNNRMNIGPLAPDVGKKIKGLVTFGSPLDKIAFFLRERAKGNQEVRRQILDQLYSFKTKTWNPDWVPSAPVKNEIRAYLDDHTRWINFWDKKDPISGPLDFYKIKEGDNRELLQGQPWLKAHTTYWRHTEMWEQVINDLL